MSSSRRYDHMNLGNDMELYIVINSIYESRASTRAAILDSELKMILVLLIPFRIFGTSQFQGGALKVKLMSLFYLARKCFLNAPLKPAS